MLYDGGKVGDVKPITDKDYVRGCTAPLDEHREDAIVEDFRNRKN